MAAKVTIVPKRKYRFYLPVDDKDIRVMLVQNGHDIVFKQDSEWDIAVFGGGADICPMLYGEKMLDSTYCNIGRDLREVSFYKALHPDRLKVGICRGAQLLNVLSGGRLWQDVNNHASSEGHLVTLYDGDENIHVSSRHHQMMIPAANAWIIAKASESTKKTNHTFGVTEYTPEQLKNQFDDPEILYYQETNSLCFQPHPEDNDVPDCTKFFFECIDSLWDDEKHEKALKDW